jgi:hypothetical protein
MAWTTIEALEGETHLERVRLHNAKTGATETRDIQHRNGFKVVSRSTKRASSRPVPRFRTSGLSFELLICSKPVFLESSRSAISGLRA